MRGPFLGEACSPITTRPTSRSEAILAISSAGSPNAVRSSTFRPGDAGPAASTRDCSARCRRSLSVSLVEAPGWILAISPFHWVALVPSQSIDVVASVVMVAIGLAAAALGVDRFGRRDLVSA